MSERERPVLPFKVRAAIWGGRWLIRLLASTWCVRVVGREGLEALRRAKTPLIIVIWHGEMLPSLWVHRGEGIAVLISEHKDGEIIAQIAEGLGYAPSVRGSSSRGAARAVLQLVRTLESGVDVGITPDGPRGPSKEMAVGAVAAAQRAGAPLVAVRAHATSAWRLGSWDRFMIPKPFARVSVSYGAPMYVPKGDGDVLEAARASFAVVMADTGRRAGDVD